MWWIHYNNLPEVPASLWKVPVSFSGYCCDLWCSTISSTLGRHQHTGRGTALLGSWKMLFLAEKEGGKMGEISKNAGADFKLQLQSSCICIWSPVSCIQTWTWPLGCLAWPWSCLQVSWAVCDAEQCLWSHSWLPLLGALPSPVPGGDAGHLWSLEHHSSSRGTWSPHESSWNVAAEHKANPGKACWHHDVTQQLMPCSWLEADRCCLLQSDLTGVTLQTLGGDIKLPVPAPGTKSHYLEFSFLLTAAWFYHLPKHVWW